jgi:hypothetical protein
VPGPPRSVEWGLPACGLTFAAPGLARTLSRKRQVAGGDLVYRVGRFLQLLGLLIAPVGMAGNLVDPERVGEGKVLAILGGGIVVFAIGWLIQRGGKPQ